MKLLVSLAFTSLAFSQSWVAQTTGSTASLRGLSAVSPQVAWASGTGGAFLKTIDGGAHWIAAKVPGAEDLDFRDVQAFDERTAYLLSIGPGEKSRIYKTTDGGATWKLQFTNPDAKGFFDAMAFWDQRRGLLVGDPVDGRIVVMTTSDGGEHWERRPTPPAIAGEGAFAASGTCLITTGSHDAWIATGGTGAARIFHSSDDGKSWTVVSTPIRNDGASAGIFSLAFSDGRHGIAVGGDYNKTTDTERTIAITSDGGRTWTAPKATPHGFRSAVAYLPDMKMWIAAGPSGSDFSRDGGVTWTSFDNTALNAIAFVKGNAGWGAGPKGRIVSFDPKPRP